MPRPADSARSERIEKAFSRVLRSTRLQRGLSQEALAHEADMHRNHVGLMERGERSPSLKAVFKLAEALGTSPSALVREVEVLARPSIARRAAEGRGGYSSARQRARK